MRVTVASTADRNNGARPENVAAQLCAKNVDPDLDICLERRWRGMFVVEGLGVKDGCVDVFKPVQKCWLRSHRWRLLQSLSPAEHGVRSFLLDRPDLQG